jgi:MoxR-like ATPase
LDLAERRKEKRDEEALSPARLQKLMDAVNGVILGKEEVVRKVLIALLARGNLLIEDIPGVGKTTLAQALARSIRCSFQRIQFTSDLLPSDILGVKVYEPSTSEFKFMPGPIFNSIVLADEINRATPRTQSALLEAMNEKQVTIEGETLALPRPFMVIATENPIEHHGTYPLPDSQLDRFLMSVGVGYPGLEHERMILTRRVEPGSTDLAPVMDGSEVLQWQGRVDKVMMAPEIVDYVLEIASRSRSHGKLRLGVSPRGTLALKQAAKAAALIAGREFCVPDDVKSLSVPVLAHRVMVSAQGGVEEKRRAAVEVVEEILDTVRPPL